ncbi:hypothetical protein B1R32_106165 [Abditibacterium utsteinense]|uniref:Uncharacterized protein n=1 Tax=Abditibacterium utsteinense TaxID=1960156 RepID=A0A2S8SU89_9BACT|nr:hypothetical protein [Abditibacterium utsteinense]PQV64319.1 hypothetical protein B1R32_106165 [Abditibacterium utsteinense]
MKRSHFQRAKHGDDYHQRVSHKIDNMFRMRKWFLFSLLMLAFPARAQTAAPSQKIEYRRDMPKSVACLMPRGAKSLFWGRFTPKAGSAPMALHLFDVGLNSHDDYHKHLMLDVFLLLNKPRRVNRVKSLSSL